MRQNQKAARKNEPAMVLGVSFIPHDDPLVVLHHTRRLRASRAPLRPKPRSDRPNELWGIDMTKILVASWGWMYVLLPVNQVVN